MPFRSPCGFFVRTLCTDAVSRSVRFFCADTLHGCRFAVRAVFCADTLHGCRFAARAVFCADTLHGCRLAARAKKPAHGFRGRARRLVHHVRGETLSHFLTERLHVHSDPHGFHSKAGEIAVYRPIFGLGEPLFWRAFKLLLDLPDREEN